MDRFLQVLVIIVALVILVAGTLYITQHTSVGCQDFLFFKTCGAVITK